MNSFYREVLLRGCFAKRIDRKAGMVLNLSFRINCAFGESRLALARHENKDVRNLSGRPIAKREAQPPNARVVSVHIHVHVNYLYRRRRAVTDFNFVPAVTSEINLAVDVLYPFIPQLRRGEIPIRVIAIRYYRSFL